MNLNTPTATLQAYEKALVSSDVDAVMQVYADDGVFLPQHSQPAIGRTAIRAAYEAVFRAIKLDIKFTIAEVQEVGGGWAFARTSSAGTTTIQANGAKVKEANSELFLLRRQAGGNWLISRYIFTTTNPQ